MAFKFSPCLPCCTQPPAIGFTECPVYVYHRVDATGALSASGDYVQYIGQTSQNGSIYDIVAKVTEDNFGPSPYYEIYSQTKIEGLSPFSSGSWDDITYDAYSMSDLSLPIESGVLLCSGSGSYVSCIDVNTITNLGVVARRPGFSPYPLSGIFVNGVYSGPHVIVSGDETILGQTIQHANQLLFAPDDPRTVTIDLTGSCRGVVDGSMRIWDFDTKGAIFDKSAGFSFVSDPTFVAPYNRAVVSGLKDLTAYAMEVTVSTPGYRYGGLIPGLRGLVHGYNSGTVQYSGVFVLCGDGYAGDLIVPQSGWMCCGNYIDKSINPPVGVNKPCTTQPFEYVPSIMVATACGVTFNMTYVSGTDTTVTWKGSGSAKAPVIPTGCYSNNYSEYKFTGAGLDSSMCSGIWTQSGPFRNTYGLCARSGTGDAFFDSTYTCGQLTLTKYNTCSKITYGPAFFRPTTATKYVVINGVYSPCGFASRPLCSGYVGDYPGQCCFDAKDTGSFSCEFYGIKDRELLGDWKDYECFFISPGGTLNEGLAISAGSGTGFSQWGSIYCDETFMLLSGVLGTECSNLATINRI